jgi:hypothetical protein
LGVYFVSVGVEWEMRVSFESRREKDEENEGGKSNKFKNIKKKKKKKKEEKSWDKISCWR